MHFNYNLVALMALEASFVAGAALNARQDQAASPKVAAAQVMQGGVSHKSEETRGTISRDVC